MRTAKEILKDFRGNYGWKFWDEAMEFLVNWQSEHQDLGIVDCDELDDLVAYKAEQGYQTLAHYLSGIMDNLNGSYYRIDGYGNLETIERGNIDSWLDDIANDRM